MLEALATVSSLAFMAVIDFLLAYFGGDWLDRRSGCCLRQHHDQRRGICGNERLPCTGRTVMKF